MRIHPLLVSAIPVGWASAKATGQVMLTTLTLFSSTSGGAYNGQEGWDTSYGVVYKIWLMDGGYTGGTFINGPLAAAVFPSIPMLPGTHTLGLVVEPGGTVGYHGLNLFFDGSSSPGISAVAPDHTGLFDASSVAANGSSSTLNVGGVAGLQGAGTLSYSGSGVNITLTDFYLGSPSLYVDDRVSGLSALPSGVPDRVGILTLQVTAIPVPEPEQMAALAALGLALFCGGRRLRTRFVP